MKKLLLIAVFCLFSGVLFAKTTYIYNNNRMNFVKVEDASNNELKVCQPTQPVTISEKNMRDILKAVKVSRTFIIKEDVDDQGVFNEREINFLAPKIVEGLSKATDKERVTISYMVKDPTFIMRNDRLTIAVIWVCGDDMHMRFEKLMAKLTGDYDKRSDYSKVISQSRGLRIKLELQDGQSYGQSTDELIVNLKYDFSEEPPPAPVATETGKGKTVVAVQPPSEAKTTKERLNELDNLKADGLITEKEYKKKRKAIIEGL